MIKLIATFRRPADPQQWMMEFLSEHAPRLRSLPNLERLELLAPFDTLAGGDRRGAPVLITELCFDSRDDFDAAMVSDTGRVTMEALQDFAGSDLTLLLAEVEER